MKTLTVDEAVAGLDKWVELALAGEQIRIRQGDSVVELRPAPCFRAGSAADVRTPREALHRLQQGAHLTVAEAEGYLGEVREERLAMEDRRPV